MEPLLHGVMTSATSRMPLQMQRYTPSMKARWALTGQREGDWSRGNMKVTASAYSHYSSIFLWSTALLTTNITHCKFKEADEFCRNGAWSRAFWRGEAGRD